MYKCNIVPCIGVVQCPKIIDGEVEGIYVMPVKICIDKQWYNTIVTSPIPRKYYSYPELLSSIMDLSVITTIIPRIECVGTIELDNKQM
jgi:hypothetical protein